jgi:hypothetical protein
MTATDEDDTDGVPDPAGNLAALFESGDLELAYDTDTDELREFVEAAESGALGPVDAELEATVRIARSLLSDGDEDGDTDSDPSRD